MIMRTERVPEPCPSCGNPYLWKITGSNGVTMECPACDYWRAEDDG